MALADCQVPGRSLGYAQDIVELYVVLQEGIADLLFWFSWTLNFVVDHTGFPPTGFPSMLLIPITIAAGSYILMQGMVFPLVDAVMIDEDMIVVRNRGQEDRFPITQSINVKASKFENPERIVLTLKDPCRFGREIIFLPPGRWWLFSRHPLVEELIRLTRQNDDKHPDAISEHPVGS